LSGPWKPPKLTRLFLGRAVQDGAIFHGIIAGIFLTPNADSGDTPCAPLSELLSKVITMALSINKGSSALLVMDCQEGIVGALPTTERQRLMPVLQRGMAAARAAGVPVIHVVVGFREGHPEIGKTGWFKAVKEAGRMKIGSPEAQICKEVAPQQGDVIVTKKRMSAFTGSDLQQVLYGRGITTVVLTGVSSVGVVESTARDAVDMDLDIVVLADGCADRDPVVNEAALKHLLPRIASVVNTEEFVAALGGAKQPATQA